MKLILRNPLISFGPLLALLHSSFSNADFGDYADLSFQCPLRTTCPVVCVSDLSECPSLIAFCPLDTPFQCPDGSCVTTEDNCNDLALNQCESNICGKTVPCPKIVLEQEECLDAFQDAYDAAQNCTEVDLIEPAHKVPWNAPGFILMYVWFILVTSSIIGWCAWNQRMAPVGETTYLDDCNTVKDGNGRRRRRSSYQSLLQDAESGKLGNGENGTLSETDYDWSQTGYKNSSIGTLLYGFTIATIWGFQVALATFVGLYYAQQNGHTKYNPFESETQVLLIFEIVWMVAFVWNFSLKWPKSIYELFLRRSHFDTATHIAVFSPIRKQSNEHMPPYIKTIGAWMEQLYLGIDSVFGLLFSVQRTKVRGTFTFCEVHTDGGTGTRYFVYRLRRYNYSEEAGCFVPGVIPVPKKIGSLLGAASGLTDEEVTERRAVVGSNVIPMIQPNLFSIIVNEFNKPFYLWQNLATWVWFNFWYYHMGVVNTLVYILGGVANSIVKYRNDCNLYRLGEVCGSFDVLRNGKYMSLDQADVVPGDIIKLAPGQAYCDMVILQGSSILVDESALTGEATPISKTALDPADSDSFYSPSGNKKCTISAGTTILESDPNTALAFVTNTGSFTSKGELLRDILFYERHKFKFDIEIEIVMVILIVQAIFSFWLIVLMLGEQPVYSWFYGMYVVACCVPPLLPTTFVVSVGISTDRLFKKRIATADPHGILVAGKVKMAFFDKTGTLTNQGMDFIPDSDMSPALSKGMAVTHTLTKIKEGRHIGHFIDVTMFEATGATMTHLESGDIEVATNEGQRMTVVKRFEFDHHRMTQSVIVQDWDSDQLTAYVKGSPEAIKKICTSGIPADFDQRARASAKEGTYQICVASKKLTMNRPAQMVARGDIECDLEFTGFLSFKNTLKEETPVVIRQLREGDVTSTIVTGDNVFTGIHIAREAGIVDPKCQVVLGVDIDKEDNIHWIDSTTDDDVPAPTSSQLQSGEVVIALTGQVWSAVATSSMEALAPLAPYIRVIGRCTPNDKVSVVSYFVKQGFITLMCGDGGNDCGALKTAHVGVALSQAEASVVSPFTSLDLSISSVLDVLKEGRCCLASALSSYKFMIMYGQIEAFLQVVGAYYQIALSEWPWVFFDGFWLISLAFTLPLSQAAETLAPERPTCSLLGKTTMSSAVGILGINMIFTSMAMVFLGHQDWYQCRAWANQDISNILVLGDNYESTVLFLMSAWQFPASAFPYSLGFLHRAKWWKNQIFQFFFVLWIILLLVVSFYPSKASCMFRVNCNNDDVVRGVHTGLVAINNEWNTTEMPMDFRIRLVVIMFANLITNILWEWLVVNTFLKKKNLKSEGLKVSVQSDGHSQKKNGRDV